MYFVPSASGKKRQRFLTFGVSRRITARRFFKNEKSRKTRPTNRRRNFAYLSQARASLRRVPNLAFPKVSHDFLEDVRKKTAGLHNFKRRREIPRGARRTISGNQRFHGKFLAISSLAVECTVELGIIAGQFQEPSGAL